MEFDDVLNECLERMLHGETIDQCLSRFPQYADKLKPLLDTGLQVKKAVAVDPRPEFRASARRQFQAALDASESKPKFSFLYWLKQPQWAAVTAFALLIVLGTSTAVLANGSMPDQALYPVKLAMEKIQISLTPSAESRGELYARFLERRIDEITIMAAENKPGKILLVTDRLNAMVSAIASSTAVTLDTDASKTAAPQITGIAPAAPPQAASPAPAVEPPLGQNQPGIAATAPAIAGAAPAATANATAPFSAETGKVAAELPEVTGITSSSTVTMLNNAAVNLARLRDMLASTPEAERPALQDAIAAAENTYEALVKYLSAE